MEKADKKRGISQGIVTRPRGSKDYGEEWPGDGLFQIDLPLWGSKEMGRQGKGCCSNCEQVNKV